MGRIVIVAGPPGAGKTTVADRLSRRTAAPFSLHMHTDDFYGYIRNGFVPPSQPESRRQNLVLLNAMAASAAVCARGRRVDSTGRSVLQTVEIVLAGLAEGRFRLT